MGKGSGASRRPIIILAVVFLVATVITGVVVWKVTKDAYDDEGSPEDNVRVIEGTAGATKGGADNNGGVEGNGGTDSKGVSGDTGGGEVKDNTGETPSTERPQTEEVDVLHCLLPARSLN